MKTRIEIDDQLLRRAMKVNCGRTKRATVEEGLRLLVRLNEQTSMRNLHGSVQWDGDVEISRRGRKFK